jgi:hypothetical protein
MRLRVAALKGFRLRVGNVGMLASSDAIHFGSLPRRLPPEVAASRCRTNIGSSICWRSARSAASMWVRSMKFTSVARRAKNAEL